MAILELDQIYDVSEFEISWKSLLSKSFDNNPFVTYEWLSAWVRHFGEGKESKLFTSEKNGQVSVAVPIMFSKQKVLGSQRSEAKFIGAPDCDYQTFLITNFQEATRTIGPLIKTIVDSSNVDNVELSDVPGDSLTAKLLQHTKGDSFTGNRSLSNKCPYITLPKNYESYVDNLGKNMRRNLKRYEKQALKDFDVQFLKYDKVGTVQEAMKILFRLHQKRQNAKGEYGVFSNDTIRRFHIDLAQSFARNNWLALFFLTFNDIPVSAVYAFEYNGKLYGYLSGFDPEYASYEPGQIAIQYLIKYAISRNLKELDFLRGDEAYKAHWTNSARNNLMISFNKTSLKSRFYNWNMSHRPASYLYGAQVLSQRFLANALHKAV